MIFASCFQFVFFKKKQQVAVKKEATSYENRLCLKWLGLLAVYKARLFFYSLTGLSSVLFSWICFSFSYLKVCGGGGVGQGSVKLFSSKLTLVILSSVMTSNIISWCSLPGSYLPAWLSPLKISSPILHVWPASTGCWISASSWPCPYCTWVLAHLNTRHFYKWQL